MLSNLLAGTHTHTSGSYLRARRSPQPGRPPASVRQPRVGTCAGQNHVGLRGLQARVASLSRQDKIPMLLLLQPDHFLQLFSLNTMMREILLLLSPAPTSNEVFKRSVHLRRSARSPLAPETTLQSTHTSSYRYSFNDTGVKQFDPNQIGSECFSGEMSSRTYEQK